MTTGLAPPADAVSNVLKETLIQAGLELLDREELTLTNDSISYPQVFEYLEAKYSIRVTRGSVHERIWANHEEFRRDVLAEAVAYFPTGGLPSSTIMDICYSVAAAAGAESDPGIRVVDFSRRVGHRIYAEAMASQAFGKFQAAKAVASRFNDPAGVEVLHRLINKRIEETGAEIADKSPRLIALLGLRPKAALGLTRSQSGELSQTLRRGLMNGAHLDSSGGSKAIVTPVEFMGVPCDAEEPWLPATIGANSFYEFLLETDVERTAAQKAPSPDWLVRKPPPMDPESGTSASGRRPRHELKRLVLAAGVELLLERGLDLKPQSLSYRAVIAGVRETHGFVVHRGSVHKRIWDSHDDFRMEVLGRALRVRPELYQSVTQAFEAASGALRPEDQFDRYQTALDLIRTTTKMLTDVSANSVQYRRLLLAKASLIDRPGSQATNSLSSAIARADGERRGAYKTLFQRHVLDLGFRAKPELEITEGQALDLIAILTSATITGTTLDALAGVEQATRTYSLPRKDDIKTFNDWTPAAIAISAYFDQTYEAI